MANRYIASVRRIKLITDFGWKSINGLKPVFKLNDCIATLGVNPWIVARPNGEMREFSTTGKTYAQVHQEMTNYALGKED